MSTQSLDICSQKYLFSKWGDWKSGFLRQFKIKPGGIPWWSSGWDSGDFASRAQVQSLIREQRSYKLCDTAKK